MALQVHNVCGDGTLRRTASQYTDANRADTGFIRRVPRHPGKLAVAVRVIDIADCVGVALDDELYGYRVVRI